MSASGSSSYFVSNLQYTTSPLKTQAYVTYKWNIFAQANHLHIHQKLKTCCTVISMHEHTLIIQGFSSKFFANYCTKIGQKSHQNSKNENCV